MEKNTPKTDRRTRRTRQALYHGLIQLLEEKPVAEISVKELCQVCDLNRSTFYLHYASVQELLEAMEQEILEVYKQFDSFKTYEQFVKWIAGLCVSAFQKLDSSMESYHNQVYNMALGYIKENFGSFYFTCNDYTKLIELMMHDKKNIAETINFTLLADIGNIKINQTATKKEIAESLDFFRES